MKGSPFIVQAAAPLLVTRNRCTRVPAAPCPLDAVTVTPLVVHGCAAWATVVVVGTGAVVVVDVVIAGGTGLGVDEQPASTNASEAR